MHAFVPDSGPSRARGEHRRCRSRGCRGMGEARTSAGPCASAPDRRWPFGVVAMRGCSKTLHPFHRAGAACIGFAVFAVVCGDASAAEPGRTAQASPLLSTLAQVAARVASELGPSVKEPAVFVGPVRSDETVVRAAELASRIAGLLPRALGPRADTASHPVPL